MPVSAHRRWNVPRGRALGNEGMLRAVRLAPVLAPFSKIADPESMHSSFAEELRDRIFNPVLPPFPRTRMRPAGVETTTPRFRIAYVFAPVDFRWQRKRKMWDRGAAWQAPSGIGLVPACKLPRWPGPFSEAG